jgi:antitoxin (DNA-binding transcriptional repressor) of toxin-antitoxin stability system
MIRTITATEAARNFSEILNSIRYRGDRYTILKGGKPTATIGPVVGFGKDYRLAELRNIIETLPRLESDGESFARDIGRVIEEQPPMKEGSPWA